jgi:DNA-binding NtrC family response regulator
MDTWHGFSDILVVDDNEINRDVVAELVGNSINCHIRQASGGSEALAWTVIRSAVRSGPTIARPAFR